MSKKKSQILNLSKVDQGTIDIVSGYIKICQTLLPNDNSFYNIPSLVECICIEYYWVYEHFTKHGQYFSLNDERNVATHKGFHDDTVYGNIKIDNKPILYEWIFKIVEDGSIYIGIDSSNKAFCDSDFSERDKNKNDFYSYGYVGKKLSHLKGEYYGSYFNPGDVIRMILNVQNQTLEYFVNDKSQGIAYKNISFDDKTYHMAIFMNNKNGQI